MRQIALVIVLWSSFCVPTLLGSDGCGVLTGSRELSASFGPPHKDQVVEKIVVHCNSTRHPRQLALMVLMNASSLLNVIASTELGQSRLRLNLYLTFSHSVSISSDVDDGVKRKEHQWKRSLTSPLEFDIVAVGNESNVSISNASVAVTLISGEFEDVTDLTKFNLTDTNITTIKTVILQTTMASTMSPYSPTLPSESGSGDSNDVFYIVGLVVTSSIAMVSIIVCIILCLKLKKASRTHHYVEPLPVDLQAVRLPAKLPPRAMSDPELLGAKARTSIAYDYAFVDGPPLITVARRNSDVEFGNGIPGISRHERCKKQLERTRSSSEPFLYPPGLRMDLNKRTRPKPPPKPQLSAVRKMKSADDIHEKAVYDDPYPPAQGNRKAGKPIPSPRMKKKELAKTKSNKSTTTDGYLRPVVSDSRHKTSLSAVNANNSNHSDSEYVPMEVEHVVNIKADVEDDYIPMQSLTSPSTCSQSKVVQPLSVTDSDGYDDVEEWLDHSKNS